MTRKLEKAGGILLVIIFLPLIIAALLICLVCVLIFIPVDRRKYKKSGYPLPYHFGITSSLSYKVFPAVQASGAPYQLLKTPDYKYYLLGNGAPTLVAVADELELCRNETGAWCYNVFNEAEDEGDEEKEPEKVDLFEALIRLGTEHGVAADRVYALLPEDLEEVCGDMSDDDIAAMQADPRFINRDTFTALLEKAAGEP